MAYKRPDKGRLSAAEQAQGRRLVKSLREMIDRLEHEPPHGPAETAAVTRPPETQLRGRRKTAAVAG